MRSTSLMRPGLDLLGHAGLLDLLAQLVDLGLLRVVLAQLALDGLQLLAQDVLALGLVHLGLDLGLDLALQLEDLDLASEEAGDELQALDDVDRLEQLLALLGGHVRAVGDHVGEQARLGDVAGGDGRLGRHRRAGLDVLLDLRLDGADQRLDLDVRWPAASLSTSTRAKMNGSARRSRAARRRCWPWTMARTVPSCSCTTWAILASVPTSYSSDGSLMSSRSAWRCVTSAMGELVGDGLVQRLDRLVPADLERHDHLREDDRLAQRDERAARGTVDSSAARRLGSAGSWVLRVPRSPEVSASAPRAVRRRVGLGTGDASSLGSRYCPCRAVPGCACPVAPRARRGCARLRGSRPGSGSGGGSRGPAGCRSRSRAGYWSGARRADQALVLVDAQGARMHAHQLGRHADDVDGPAGVAAHISAHGISHDG